MSDTNTHLTSFRDLNLPISLLKALDQVGYETPSPIQAQTIPHMLQGRDLLGHAPTGTGKTAAFALPLLSRLDTKLTTIQVLVLTPTRELAIQVAEAFQRYASHIKGFHVLPVYGGQDYSGQIRQLKRGVHVVVGTPGRVMDHMRRGTLKLDSLQALVLDEADEMLRMGFIDDVEWILEQTPEAHQTALFSATMPKEIQHIARHHLNNPCEIAIKTRTATADTIRQRYWQVSGLHKLDALTRILEVEAFDAIIIFVRTKTATNELAGRLEARGYAAAALNGDMVQKQREQMVERLKRGSLDILVATDVAARGLDVERISHVINYDIPYDTEAYIHRIGRTGRAGRIGDAILFVAPRERRLLNAIEKATRQKIAALELPTNEMVNNKRIADFKQRISDTIAAGELAFMQGLLEQFQQEHDVPALEIAAALAKLSMGDRPLLLEPEREKPATRDKKTKKGNDAKDRHQHRSQTQPAQGMERFRIEVGHQHQVKPGNIVGAIANEAGLDAEYIGHIDIHDDFSLVDLPAGMPQEIYQDLKKAWVCGQRMKISRLQQPVRAKKPPRKRKKRSKSD
jgi:ATP-dependent RNA helicase DeaD